MKQLVTVLLPFGCLALAGCSKPDHRIEFHLTDQRPEYELSYFPIVERDGKYYTATAIHKTADMSGYHKAEVNAAYPHNLGSAWETDSRSLKERVGIVIMERDEEDRPILDSAKVFWLNIPREQLDDPGIHVEIPELSSLPKFDTSVVIEED